GAEGKAEDEWLLGATALGLGAASAIGLVHDLARVHAADGACSVYVAVARALGAMRRRGGRLFFRWAWRALAGAAAVWGAAMIASALGASSPASLGASAIVHQAGVLVVVCWRASFLGFAVTMAGDARDV